MSVQKRSTQFATLIAGVSALAFATPGWSQQVGTYSGQTADGNYITLTVSANGSALDITEMDLSFTAPCKGGGKAQEGWGFGLDKPIKNGKGSLTYNSDDYFYIKGNANFQSKTKVTGKVESITAILGPHKKAPTEARFCTSPTQAFSATFQGNGARLHVAKGAALNFRTE